MPPGTLLRFYPPSRDADPTQSNNDQGDGSSDSKGDTSSSTWKEPALSQKPSYRDHNGVLYYGVSEHMQPLGEAPNAKVRTRVRADGARKSVLGRSAAGGGLDAQETPEGTPVPPSSTPTQQVLSPPPQIVIKDEDDADYAPKANGKKKERSTKPRAAKRRSEPTVKPESKIQPPDPRSFNLKMIRGVVEDAKKRAVLAGKPDLADAVHEIFLQSLKNGEVMKLLQAILSQKATTEETNQFQTHVKAAKKKLRERQRANEPTVREGPESSSNGTQSLPLRSPSRFTSHELETSALPSTEVTDSSKLNALKQTLKDSTHRRSGKTGEMSASPSKRREREGSAASDSSLTDMTSNPDDDMDVDDAVPAPPTPSRGALTPAKDQAAERGSLAPPNRNLKRSSVDADLHDQERDRTLAAKKQRLNDSITRDGVYEESSVREPVESRSERLRTRQGKNVNLAIPSLSQKVGSGGPLQNGLGSRGVSTDLDSPLSTPGSSRQSTPHVYTGPKKPFGKKAKTKQSPEKKQTTGPGGMPGASGAGKDSPIGDDDNEELSENNDFCSACGASGFLLCCDGCDRSFHFSCLDPPLNEDASELNEPWFCYVCVGKRPLATDSPEKVQRGLFAPLFTTLRKRNPSNFALPQDVRDYFEGVATDKTGSFLEAVHTRTRNRPGYTDEIPDFTKVKDAKGKTILCFHCGKSSGGTRLTIPCDFCGEYWHLDCLDPPRTNPPARNQDGIKVHDWMCPLHADHDLRKVDTMLLASRSAGRKLHVRKPRNAKITETSLRRGHRNNGVVDVVIDDESDDSGDEFYDEDQVEEGVVYRLPASGIKLDFIDKVKSTRALQVKSQNIHAHALAVASPTPRPLDQANFARRSFRDQQMALNLAQFATLNKDLDLGSDQVQNLVGTLIAEAPADVVDNIAAAESIAGTKSASTAVPPSPPTSEQTEVLSAEQRKELSVLQELIRRKLEGGKT